MARTSIVLILVLCSILVEGNIFIEVFKQKADEIKKDVDHQMTAASDRARQTARNVLIGISGAISDSEAWIEQGLIQHAESFDQHCKPDTNDMKKVVHESLWKCLQMARVVTDGTDIASGGFSVAADIVGTADNLLKSLTACIIGPSQSVSQLIACYLSALGTIATGVAENIEQVEHYITVVKRDVADIHAAIAICRNETYDHSVQHMHDHHNHCKQKSTTEMERTSSTRTEPTLPTETEPSLPTETEPSIPTETEPSLPTETEPSLPTETEPSIPTETEPSLSTETESTLPNEEEPTSSTDSSWDSTPVLPTDLPDISIDQ